MLLAPALSQMPPIFGWMPSASASFWPYIISKREVGALTKSASTSRFSTPASTSALRIASTLSETVLRPGSLPNAVWPMPAITALPLSRARVHDGDRTHQITSSRASSAISDFDSPSQSP